MAKSGRSKTVHSEVMLQALEANLTRRILRMSGQLGISRIDELILWCTENIQNHLTQPNNINVLIFLYGIMLEPLDKYADIILNFSNIDNDVKMVLNNQ